jgi:hypothetical protein
MFMSSVSSANSASESSLATILVPVIAVAFVAGLCAAFTHIGCFHPPPPVTRPNPSTPRGEYCSAINATRPWISLTAVPVLVTAALAFSARHHPRLVALGTLLVCLLLIANAGVANSLTSSLTI